MEISMYRLIEDEEEVGIINLCDGCCETLQHSPEDIHLDYWEPTNSPCSICQEEE